MSGNVSGIRSGNMSGNMRENVSGIGSGNVSGNVSGNISENMSGIRRENMSGNVIMKMKEKKKTGEHTTKYPIKIVCITTTHSTRPKQKEKR